MVGLLFVVSLTIFVFFSAYTAFFYSGNFDLSKDVVLNTIPFLAAGVFGFIFTLIVRAEGGFAWESTQELWYSFQHNLTTIIFMLCVSAGFFVFGHVSWNYLQNGSWLYPKNGEGFMSFCLSSAFAAGSFLLFIPFMSWDRCLV